MPDGTEVIIPATFILFGTSTAVLHLKRPTGLLGALLLVALLLPVSRDPGRRASGASVPAGFRDEAVFTGLDHPMAVAFASDGSVFVAEKRGTILRLLDSLTDTTPTVFADLNDQRPQLLGPRA